MKKISLSVKINIYISLIIALATLAAINVCLPRVLSYQFCQLDAFVKTDQCVNWENGFEDVENFGKATPKGLRKLLRTAHPE